MFQDSHETTWEAATRVKILAVASGFYHCTFTRNRTSYDLWVPVIFNDFPLVPESPGLFIQRNLDKDQSKISTDSNTVILYTGQTLELECKVQRFRKSAGIKWLVSLANFDRQVDVQDLIQHGGHEQLNFTLEFTRTRPMGSHNVRLTVRNVTREHQGRYTCRSDEKGRKEKVDYLRKKRELEGVNLKGPNIISSTLNIKVCNFFKMADLNNNFYSICYRKMFNR